MDWNPFELNSWITWLFFRPSQICYTTVRVKVTNSLRKSIRKKPFKIMFYKLHKDLQVVNLQLWNRYPSYSSACHDRTHTAAHPNDRVPELWGYIFPTTRQLMGLYLTKTENQWVPTKLDLRLFRGRLEIVLWRECPMRENYDFWPATVCVLSWNALQSVEHFCASTL